MIEKRLDGTLVFDSVQELREYEGEKGKAQEKAWVTRKHKYGDAGRVGLNPVQPKCLTQKRFKVDGRGSGNHKRWTTSELNMAVIMLKGGRTTSEIGKELGKTEQAVRIYLQRGGCSVVKGFFRGVKLPQVSIKARTNTIWLPKEKKLLKTLWIAGTSRLQMKKALGRTWIAIYQQAWAMGLVSKKKQGKVNKQGSSPYSRFMGVAIKKALDSGAKSPQEAMQMAIAEWNKQKSNGKGETNGKVQNQ